MKKLKAFWSLFHAGKRVANPVAWKMGTVSVEAVRAFLSALVAVVFVFTGMEVEVGEAVIDSLAVSLVAIVPMAVSLFNIVSTVVSTAKIGLRAEP